MLAIEELEYTAKRIKLIETNINESSEKEMAVLVYENLNNMIKQLKVIEQQINVQNNKI